MSLLDAYAGRLGIPVADLRDLGWANMPDGTVAISYGPGAQRRVRAGLSRRDGCWTETRRVLNYVDGELQRTHEGTLSRKLPTKCRVDRGTNRPTDLIICEGETDAAVLRHHGGYSVLTLPGAGTTSKIEGKHLVGFRTVYAIREPDAGGATIGTKLPPRLRELGFTGPIRLVHLEGCKDPCELWEAVRSRGAFRAAIDRAMDHAMEVEVTAAPTRRAPSALREASEPFTFDGTGRAAADLDRGHERQRRADWAAMRDAADMREAATRLFGPADRSGRWLCPGHADTNPSLGLTPDKKHVKCHVCGFSEDAVGLVQLVNGGNLVDSCSFLGIEPRWLDESPSNKASCAPADCCRGPAASGCGGDNVRFFSTESLCSEKSDTPLAAGLPFPAELLARGRPIDPQEIGFVPAEVPATERCERPLRGFFRHRDDPSKRTIAVHRCGSCGGCRRHHRSAKKGLYAQGPVPLIGTLSATVGEGEQRTKLYVARDLESSSPVFYAGKIEKDKLQAAIKAIRRKRGEYLWVEAGEFLWVLATSGFRGGSCCSLSKACAALELTLDAVPDERLEDGGRWMSTSHGWAAPPRERKLELLGRPTSDTPTTEHIRELLENEGATTERRRTREGFDVIDAIVRPDFQNDDFMRVASITPAWELRLQREHWERHGIKRRRRRGRDAKEAACASAADWSAF